MAPVIHLDTHVVAWLWVGDRARLEPVAGLIEGHELRISPMVTLELEYLHEIGRMTASGATVVADLVARIGLGVSTTALCDVVARALDLRWTRDPFDRLIVANAMTDGVSLLTRDATIRANFARAVWGATTPG